MSVRRSVFVSKPNTLNPEQLQFWEELRRILDGRGLEPRTLGETDYPNTAPIHAVRRVLEDCQGAIVLGLAQLRVDKGAAKVGSDKERSAAGTVWPSPWNHIESGMAYMLDLPLLIMREEQVAGGIFDVGNTDRYIHQAEMSSTWLSGESFLQPFNEWCDEVVRREH